MPDSTVETTCVLKSSAMCESKTEIVNFFQDNQIRVDFIKEWCTGQSIVPNFWYALWALGDAKVWHGHKA